ncbi:MAG: hypothetical protein WBG37_12875, partial [Desulfobacterales bacterium]
PCPSTPPVLKIDFETFPGPDGELGTVDDIAPSRGTGAELSPVLALSDEYSSVGVVFDRATLFWGPVFGAEAGFENFFLSSSPVEARFSIPVVGIEIKSYSVWNAKLTAYDSNDRVLAVANLWHPANPTPGSIGPRFLGKLSLHTNEPIARFTVIEQSDNHELILNLDSLVLTTRP